MNQDPNPVDPSKVTSFVLILDGAEYPAAIIPKLFAAYVAASRAEYYAGVDDARNPGCFEQVFHEEFRHALRDRSEIKDWMENNMDPQDEPADDVSVALRGA